MNVTKESLEGLPAKTLREIYRKNDQTKYSAQTIKFAKEILEERGEEIPEQEEVKEAKESEESKEEKEKSDKEEEEIVTVRDKLDKIIEQMDQEGGESRWKHKIISGPVLSGQSKLQSKLNKLGKSGWELVDTQRHSIGGKQHAVCFLKKEKSSHYTGP